MNKTSKIILFILLVITINLVMLAANYLMDGNEFDWKDRLLFSLPFTVMFSLVYFEKIVTKDFISLKFIAYYAFVILISFATAFILYGNDFDFKSSFFNGLAVVISFIVIVSIATIFKSPFTLSKTED